MKEKIKHFFQQKNNLIAVTLVGLLLLVIAMPTGDRKADTSVGDSTADAKSQSLGEDYPAGEGVAGYGSETYAVALEKKLETILSQMDGAGAVQVMITLQSSEEKVVEKDQPVNRSETNETDSQGGTREISTIDQGESTVFGQGEGGSQPYVVKVLQPRVEGVLVLAQGAGTGSVSKNISEAIQALFDIDAHKIRVVKMKSGNSSVGEG